MADRLDVIVLGVGVGGEEVTGRLAEAGLAVLGIEDRLVGGECPYWGCIPSKMMIRAGNLIAEARRIDGVSGHAEVVPDWTPVAARIRDEATADWNDQAAVDRLTGKGARILRGRGRLIGPGQVRVGDDVFTAERGVVIATGTEPAIPPIPGLADAPYWTNRDAIEAAELPESLLILGGGAIGMELAQMFARFGVRVTVVEALDRLLANEEPESSKLVTEIFEREGIEVHTGRKVVEVRGATVILEDRTELTAQRLLVATGRKANLGDIGIESVGGDPKARSLTVDDRMRAGERLWAVGDLTGHGAFTHMAMYQAGIAVRDILGRPGPAADYRAVPRVTFTDPEVGSVGLTEAQAREQGIRVQIGLSQIPDSSRGWIHKVGNEGLIKLVVDAGTGLLVGATSAGPTGGEVLSMLTLAVQAKVPVETLSHMIYAYPTFHRAVSDALSKLG